MKPRIEIVLNSTGCILTYPILGIIAAGIVIGILEAVIWTIAGISGIVASIFFNVDFTAIDSRMPIIRKAEMWIAFGGGPLGGLIYAYFEISEKWREYKTTGKGW
jgi:hypothetical protein